MATFFNLFDITILSFYIVMMFLIIKKSWFYSFYEFTKFLIVVVLSFLISKYALAYKPDFLPLSNLHFYLLLQAILFGALWFLIRFKKIFFFLNRSTLNLDRLVFVSHLNTVLSIFPSLIVAFFMTFSLFTILLSISPQSPYLQTAIEKSTVKELPYKIYFADAWSTDRNSRLFDEILFTITPNPPALESSFASLTQNQIDKQQQLINQERQKTGLPSIGMGTFTPESVIQYTPQGTNDNKPSAPTALPTPTIIATPVATAYNQTSTPASSPIETPTPTIQPTRKPTQFTIPFLQQPTPDPTNPPSSTSPPDNTPTPTATPKPVLPKLSTFEVEQKILELINQIRIQNSLSPLIWDETMAVVARAHSNDMNQRNFFGHNNPDGVDPFQRLAIGGVTYRKAAENVVGSQTAELMVKAWMNSEGHRNNILNDSFTKTGIGVSENEKYGLLGTQVFIN